MGSNLTPCTYTPPLLLFKLFLILYKIFIDIYQCLLFLVYIPIPHITHLPKPCYPSLTQPPDRTPPPKKKKKCLFFHSHKNFTSPFTSTLTPQPDPPPLRPDLPPPIFFFEFSQKLHFSVHIKPDPPPPPPPIFLFFNFHKNFGGRTGLVVRVSDSGSGDPGSILGRIGVLFP